MFPEMKKLTTSLTVNRTEHSCWHVKFELVGSGHELSTPILNTSEDSYGAVKEVMNRYTRRNVGYNSKIDAVHVHVNFPKKENQFKLIWLFTKLEPFLSTLNTRKRPFPILAEYHLMYVKNFNEKLFDDKLDYFNGTDCRAHEKGASYLHSITDYGTAEFRSIIDLTWDPKINVQNIILSQTMVKIANLPPEEFLQIIGKIEKTLPMELTIENELPIPTEAQVNTVLKILENVAKRDAFFQGSKLQPNFGIFDQKKY
jgi:hypothetical protein